MTEIVINNGKYCVWDGEDFEPCRIGPNPLSHDRVRELLDYADAYGEFNIETPVGATSSISSPMTEERRGFMKGLMTVLDLFPELSKNKGLEENKPL